MKKVQVTLKVLVLSDAEVPDDYGTGEGVPPVCATVYREGAAFLPVLSGAVCEVLRTVRGVRRRVLPEPDYFKSPFWRCPCNAAERETAPAPLARDRGELAGILGVDVFDCSLMFPKLHPENVKFIVAAPPVLALSPDPGDSTRVWMVRVWDPDEVEKRVIFETDCDDVSGLVEDALVTFEVMGVYEGHPDVLRGLDSFTIEYRGHASVFYCWGFDYW